MRLGNMIEIRRNVLYSQAKGCWGYLQIGSTAVFLGWSSTRLQGWRIQLFA